MRLFLVFSYPYLFEQKLQKKKKEKKIENVAAFSYHFWVLTEKSLKATFLILFKED